MTIKKKDFVEITYTGTVAETGEVFDTTDEALAIKEGLHTKHGHYGPQVICLGEGHVLPGLDEKLIGAELGTHTWTIVSEKAFGKKNPKLIQLIPISTFKSQKIQPVVGLQLNIDGQLGVVKVAGGGRVLVDFNHPLAGKDMIYTVTINRVITDPASKLKAMLDLTMHLHQDVPITISSTPLSDGHEAVIKLPSKLPDEVREKLSQHLAKSCDLKKVTITVSDITVSDTAVSDIAFPDKTETATKHLNKKLESSDEKSD